MAIVTAHVAAVQQLYVAYFNRPADTAGLEYWTNVVEAQKGSTALVSAAFAAEAEYKTEYTGLSNADVVNKVYLNLFGRPAEDAGKAYWADLLDKKAITIDKVVAEISKAALTTDKTAYANKVSGATAFTNALDTKAEQDGYRGAEANKLAKAFITSITTDATLTVATAPATLNATVAKVVIAGTPFTLQSGLSALQAANDAKTAFLDAADGKVDKVLMPETGTGSIAEKVSKAVDAVDALVPGYKAAASAGVKAAVLNDKIAANATVLANAQIAVAEDQVAISKVAGLTAAVAAQTSATAAVKAAEGTLKTAAADLAAKLAAYNSLNGTTFTVKADGTIDGLIKADSSGKLVVNASTITEEKNPGITALIAASTANEAAEKALSNAGKAADAATAQVNYLDITAGSPEATALAAVKAGMVNVTGLGAAMPTLEQIATEQAILDAKAAAPGADPALATAASDFKALVKTYTDAYADNKLVAKLEGHQTDVTNASKAITDLTKATTALTTANDLAAQLAAVNGAIANAEQAFIDHDLSLPVTLSTAGATLIASAGSDIYVAGSANASIALFGLQGNDSLFIGSKYTLNTTAKYDAAKNVITGGNDGVLEAFLFQTDTGTKVVLEKTVFGSSAATPEVVTITLTGVEVADVTLSNGIITG